MSLSNLMLYTMLQFWRCACCFCADIRMTLAVPCWVVVDDDSGSGRSWSMSKVTWMSSTMSTTPSAPAVAAVSSCGCTADVRTVTLNTSLLVEGHGADILCTARQGLWRWLARRPEPWPVERSLLLLSIILHPRQRFQRWCVVALVPVWFVELVAVDDAAVGAAGWLAWSLMTHETAVWFLDALVVVAGVCFSAAVLLRILGEFCE
eukprot:6490446-Amphidinium_carterae.2